MNSARESTKVLTKEICVCHFITKMQGNVERYTSEGEDSFFAFRFMLGQTFLVVFGQCQLDTVQCGK